MKTLGLLPGPILFGHVVDSYCTLWQDTCGVKGRCFDYDVDKLSNAVCVLGTILTCKFSIDVAEHWCLMIFIVSCLMYTQVNMMFVVLL